MPPPPHALQLHPLGETALCGVASEPLSPRQQQRFRQVASELKQLTGVEAVIPGMNNLTVVFDPLLTDPETVGSHLHMLWRAPLRSDQTPRQVEIPVHYGGADGPDLPELARHCGLSPEAVVELHSEATYTVYFLGFQPGFAYLGGLDPRLHTPRRSEPRTQVPAGSVGIGGAQTGIYPLTSPGGWQLIGRTPLALFDPHATPPTLLAAGDQVRFVPCPR